jgi:hypothetical protein
MAGVDVEGWQRSCRRLTCSSSSQADSPGFSVGADGVSAAASASFFFGRVNFWIGAHARQRQGNLFTHACQAQLGILVFQLLLQQADLLLGWAEYLRLAAGRLQLRAGQGRLQYLRAELVEAWLADAQACARFLHPARAGQRLRMTFSAPSR